MSSIEERMATVEADIIALREQVTDAHALAAHADRDVAEFRSELRAQTRLISALRETQVEQGRTQIEQGDRIDRHYAEHKADTAELKAGILQIVGMLESLGEQEDPS